MLEALEHILYIVQLGLGIGLGVEDTEIQKPELLVNRVQVKTVNYANALDDAVRVTRVLPSRISIACECRLSSTVSSKMM